MSLVNESDGSVGYGAAGQLFAFSGDLAELLRVFLKANSNRKKLNKAACMHANINIKHKRKRTKIACSDK
jgi:hypothetical protein